MTVLPTASPLRLRRECLRLFRVNRRVLAWTVGLHLAAAFIAVVPPWILGDLVSAVQHGTTTHHVDVVALVLLGVIVAQSVTMRTARFMAYSLGERLLAELREGFIARLLALPLGVVEEVRSGDLLNRATGDIEAALSDIQHALRLAPDDIVANRRLLAWADGERDPLRHSPTESAIEEIVLGLGAGAHEVGVGHAGERPRVIGRDLSHWLKA